MKSNKSFMARKIKHNDLLPWFTQDHGTLPKAYLESCPVQWFRGEVTKDHVAYYFTTPDEDEE